MKDRLKINEIRLQDSFKNKDFRLDSGFWTTVIPHNKKLIYTKIGNILESTQYGISIEMNENSLGTPIYRMNEIHNMLCDVKTGKYAILSDVEKNQFLLSNRDVLFNRTNSYEWVGRTGIYYSNSVDSVFASYLVRLIPDDKKVSPEYLTAFLNTKYGIKAIKARARQSINQTNVNPEEVKEIEIPILNQTIQAKIIDSFTHSNRLRSQAEETYLYAEKFFLCEIELQSYQPSTNAVTIKKKDQSFAKTGRLDAEYYQPKYDELESKLANILQKPLVELVYIKKSIEPGSAAYQETGIPFIRVSNITKYGLSEPDIHLAENVVTDIEKLYPKKDTILLSKDGSVGIAYKVEDDMKAVTSGALLHLKVKNTKEVNPDYLTLVLNSLVVQMQAERDAGGSIIQHWKPSEIEMVQIPILDMELQLEIASKVKESFELRKQSQTLLEKAKRAVEIAIEQDEDAALAYLGR